LPMASHGTSVAVKRPYWMGSQSTSTRHGS
jgi:hypothetical protein